MSSPLHSCTRLLLCLVCFLGCTDGGSFPLGGKNVAEEAQRHQAIRADLDAVREGDDMVEHRVDAILGGSDDNAKIAVIGAVNADHSDLIERHAAQLLRSDNVGVVGATIRAIRIVRWRGAVDSLQRFVKHDDRVLRWEAWRSLCDLGVEQYCGYREALLEDYCERLNLGSAFGWLLRNGAAEIKVVALCPGSAASQAGLAVGDVIDAIDDSEHPRLPEDLYGLAGRTSVTVRVVRGGSKIDARVEFAEGYRVQASMLEAAFGMTIP